MSVQAYVAIELHEEKCYPDGSFAFTAVNNKKDKLHTDTTNILLRNSYIRNLTIVPTGTWTRPVIYNNITESKVYTSTYISEEDQIRVKGDYHMFIDYKRCREGKCRKAIYLENCLSHSSDCDQRRPQAYSCFVDEEHAFVRFGGQQNRFFQEVNIARDLRFHITSNMRNLDGVRKVEGAAYSNVGDLKEMRFPLLKNEKITEVSVVHRGCDSPRQRMKTVKCTTQDKQVEQPKEVENVETPPEPEAQEVQQTPEEKVAEVIQKQTEIKKVEEQKQVKQELATVKNELEQAKAELARMKQKEQEERAIAAAKARAAERAVEQPEPQGLPAVTGSVVATKNAPGIPSHFYVLIAIVFVGIVLLVWSNQSKKKKARKKKKEEEEAKRFKKGPKSFGFGD